MLASRQKAIEEALAELQRAKKRMEKIAGPERGAPFYLTRAIPPPMTPEFGPSVKQDTLVQTPPDNTAATVPEPESDMPPAVKMKPISPDLERSGGAGTGIRNDPKFASYFITGGLHGPPLSVEYKKARNRAILLSIAAIVILVFVVRMLFF